MSTILSTILITVPLAFIVGWVVSKAVFVYRSTTLRQPTAVGELDTIRMPNPSVAPATNAPSNPQILKAAQILKQQLAKSQADYHSLLNEAQLLKEAVAEREHRLLELKQQISVTAIPPEEVRAGTAGLENVQQAKDMRALEKRIKAHEHEIADLRRELIHIETKKDIATSRFTKWRIKLKPFARQFRQQRLIISELREELRQREFHREHEAVEHQHELNAAIKTEASKQNAAATPSVASSATPIAAPPPVKPVEQQDNLTALKGIGPALQKKLHNQGVFRLQQLANMNAGELSKLGKSLGVSQKLISKNDWSKQAREQLGIAENETDAETTSAKDAVPA
jgi:predicted flap endonuclease-1-like 5' DNA nuclease